MDNVVADYLSRESVLVQQSPQYINVKQFYDTNITINNTHNSVRNKYSNAGGIDILKLYTHHLRISILNQTTNAHYFDHHNPYQILDENPILNEDIRYNNTLSPQSYEFLNISPMDQQIILLQSIHQNNDKQYTKTPIKPIPYHCNPMAIDEVSSGEDSDDEEQYVQQARRLPSPPPYKQPTENSNKKTE